MSELALLGGKPVVPRNRRKVAWPVVTAAERDAVQRVLDSGKFLSNTQGEQEVKGLEREWAAFTGARHCVAVGNGTVALVLALAAAGVEPGDEVLVPALSFIASGLAPLYQLAVPVFVDVDPDTFNIDPRRIEERIGPRTRAIMPVHLHGLPADMTEIRRIARRHRLLVIEDAAQAHGTTYEGRMTGTLGDVAGFSLSVTKNLPTCGEGGLITTDDDGVRERAEMMRQFGEVVRDDAERDYIAYMLGGNFKLNAVQAAFVRAQLQRFGRDQRARDANVRRLLAALEQLPGVRCPQVPHGRTHAWHILRFRFDPQAAGLADLPRGSFRQALRRVLRAEGVPVSQYQLVPLPGQKVFQDRAGFGRGYPWSLPGVPVQRYRLEDYPNALAVIEDSLTLQIRHLHPDSGPLLDLYAEAFEKIWAHLDVVAQMARSLSYEPPWQPALATLQD